MPPRRLDEIDRRILTELSATATGPMPRWRGGSGCQPRPCLARVRQLERDRLVRELCRCSTPRRWPDQRLHPVTLDRQVGRRFEPSRNGCGPIEVMECYL